MKIGILTAFSSLIEHYSLTHVVLNQLRMIKRAGHHPVLIAMDDFRSSELPSYVETRSVLRSFTKIDYASTADMSAEHQELVGVLIDQVVAAVRDLDAVLTHDIIFTGWHLPIGLATMQAAAQVTIPWLHWVHSVPGARRDYWTLPPNSKLVYPNYSDRRRCAESFGIFETDVAVIPHALDARDFLMQTDAARFIANEFKLLETDFVQTMPIPTDRMESKGVDQVVPILGCIKKLGRSVRLVVANSWCTNEVAKRKVDDVRIRARLAGLEDDEVVFTSRELKHYEAGVPNSVVRDLMLVSNLFICPTKSETFGFTIAEAALCGQLLVLNSDLPALVELAGAKNALFFHFGSYQQTTFVPNEDQFNEDVARIIINTFEHDPALKAKKQYQREYSSDRVWQAVEGEIVSMSLRSSHA